MPGRVEPYRTGRALQDGDKRLQDGQSPTGIREIVYLKETEIKTELFKLNYLICIIQIK